MKHLKMNRIFLFLIILLITIPVFAQEEPVITEEEFAAEEIAAEEPAEEVIAEETAEEADAEEIAQEEPVTEELIADEAAPAEELIAEEPASEEPAQEELVAEVEPVEEYAIPHTIRNNQYYRESLRLSKLAQDTYEYGDYDASSGFAEEAIRYAQMSDEFVSTQLIREAKRLVDWADFYKIAETSPNNVQLGKDHYSNAVAFHEEEEWNQSIDSAKKSIEVLSVLRAGTGAVADRPRTDTTTRTETATSSDDDNRNRYTVRTWAVEKDCLWNISGYNWVYGDPWQWRKLYEANKHKLPDPNNPDLIEPGIVLDIPR